MKTKRTVENGEKKNVVEKIKSSVIIRALHKFVTVIYNAVIVSVFGHIFSSHDGVEDKFGASASATLLRGGTKKNDFVRRSKNAFAEKVERSALINFLKGAKVFLLRLSLQSYGSLLFSFGFFVALAYAFKRFALPSYEAPMSALIVGIALTMLSLILFFSKKSLAQSLLSSNIARFIIFDFFGVRTEKTESAAKEQPVLHVGIPFIIGMVLGGVSFFVSPAMMLQVGVLAIALLLIFASPETGMIAVLALLPFVKTKHLIALIIIITVSYIAKFLCGRRTFKFALTDFFVLLFMIMTLSGGIFSVDRASSIKSSLVYVCFMAGYFLVKQMLGSAKMTNRALTAISVSCAVVSLIGILEYFIGSPSAIWQDSTLFSDIRGRVVSTFENPNVLGEYLILSIPVSVAMAVVSKTIRQRFAFAVSAFLGVSCLILTWSRGAWLGIILAAFITLLIVSRKWLVAAILAVPAFGVIFAYARGTLMTRLTSITNFSDSSTAYRINIWKSTLKMLSDTFFYGIGTGTGAFEKVFPYYALPGLTSVPHSHNLYLQITAETGIFALVAFLAVVFLAGQNTLSFAKSAISKKNRAIALAIFCGLLAFLLQGLTDFVFYNYRITLLFWMYLGLSSAHVSASKDSSEEKPFLY